ncbi:D-arabinitol dehydrogenase 1-like isoform X1 [Zootermopsis nevadensis]|uniref:D-arabinitol dehydrogenase 1-like isoform X1 n=1 Tax=Zootermopsis nevadensis TaxID=136037 RepID=UPI000B8E9967|nr:D-arabinitol dehydrogenase 1-like isoform X1 [Zootermopsis nevadensis]XP_021918603.1 D-arabinitol dehydrogenase 1-like isoform X1 [Zootermopsis nevadensis]XP_021918604.1 D-arabinitol dehydrogenase 1-like isoform X1 [Zootermopsis nevadensis]XP_021918606.1 D-arabinitol dehydrogenase 1-like isoform X1 [Zootermopsis nevadensis]
MMEAIQFDPQNKKLSLIKVPLPADPKKNEVVIRVAYAGICGTDLHITEGTFPCRETPVTLGHEFSGVVTSVGCDVTHIKKGDNVAVDPNSGCFTCDACHSGNYHYCSGGGIDKITGIYQNGGWAEFCVVPADQVHKLPKNISLQQAGLTEPLSCVAHGWDRITPIAVGSRILILGAGIIGNLWASVLHLQGHRRVTISEPQEARRKLLQKLETGFEIITPDELKTYRAKDLSWGMDLVIDCSGYAPAMEEALTYINPGGTLCIFGVSSPKAKMSVSPYLLYKNELKIIAVKVNPFSFPKALGMIDAMGSRYLDYEKLGIKTYSLSQYEDALQALKEGTIAKAMFKLEK